jgi:hypothetical protein
MRRLAGLVAVAGLAGAYLAGCATGPRPLCPIGQTPLRTAQLYLGRQIAGEPTPSDAAVTKFLAEEVSPRFPDGLTVIRGGETWRGADDKLVRQSAKVVLIVLPRSEDAEQRIQLVRTAYKTRFRQDAIVRITRPACVRL